jgi:hypothetical protein
VGACHKALETVSPCFKRDARPGAWCRRAMIVDPVFVSLYLAMWWGRAFEESGPSDLCNCSIEPRRDTSGDQQCGFITASLGRPCKHGGNVVNNHHKLAYESLTIRIPFAMSANTLLPVHFWAHFVAAPAGGASNLQQVSGTVTSLRFQSDHSTLQEVLGPYLKFSNFSLSDHHLTEDSDQDWYHS